MDDEPLRFVVYAKPEPQGSTRAFMRRGMRFPVVISDNKGLKSYRQQVSLCAIGAMNANGRQPIPRKVPVGVKLRFYFKRPESKSKKSEMVVRPDVDKISRSVFDALTGIVYFDDSQVVSLDAKKEYGLPERTEITVEASQ